MSIRIATILLTLILSPVAAMAADGRIEINQVCAEGPGCLLGDPPGFPVILMRAGSYVLTSDLIVSDVNLFVLDVRADDVSIDLNGFSIRGPQRCADRACGNQGLGHGIASFNISPLPNRTSVRNGSISGFSGCVVLAGDGVYVEGTSVSECTLVGIQVGDFGIVRANRVALTAFSGIKLGEDSGFAENVVAMTDLTASGTSAAIQRGHAIGGNVCTDGSCSTTGARRYYLTQTGTNGSNALDACDDGFHMASLYEVLDPSNLHYDITRGFTQQDSGSGPPAGSNFTQGWMRMGRQSLSGSGIGRVSCEAWNQFSSNVSGTTARLDPALGANLLGPWYGAVETCNTLVRVWCIEN